MRAPTFPESLGAGPHPALLAFVPPTLGQEITLGAAAVATLAGAWLCWTASLHRMLVEEDVKDGRITEDYARGRVWLRACLGPALVLAGLAVLTGGLLLCA